MKDKITKGGNGGFSWGMKPKLSRERENGPHEGFMKPKLSWGKRKWTS
jgi:hypothetical protein